MPHRAGALLGGAAMLDYGKDLTLRVGQNLFLQAARRARLTTGEDAVIQTGRAFVVKANTMMQFVAAQTGTLQVGYSFIGMNRDGNLDIFGKDIEVKSSGNLLLKGMKILQN